MHRQQGQFLSVYVDDIKMAGKAKNLESMWKKLMKHVDLEQPTFLDQVYFGCTQRERKKNKEIVDECKNLFESLIMRRNAWTDEEKTSNETKSPHLASRNSSSMKRNGETGELSKVCSHSPRMLKRARIGRPHILRSVNCRRGSQIGRFGFVGLGT